MSNAPEIQPEIEARLAMMTGNWPRAIEMFKLCLADNGETDQDPETQMDNLYSLGLCYQQLGEFDSALPCLQEAYLTQRNARVDLESIANTASVLARTYYALERPQEGLEPAIFCLAAECALGCEMPRIRLDAATVGFILLASGRQEELATKILDYTDEAQPQGALSAALMTLTQIPMQPEDRYQLGRYALWVCQALELAAEYTATVLAQQVYLAQEADREEEAEALVSLAAASGMDQMIGPEALAQIYYSRAKTCLGRREFELSVQHGAKAVELIRSVQELRPMLGYPLANLASALQHSGRRLEALAAAKEARELLRQYYPGDNQNLASMEQILASIYFWQEEYAESLSHGEEALSLMASLPPDPAVLSDLHYSQSASLLRLGRTAEAVESHEKCLRVLAEHHGGGNERADLKRTFGDLLHDAGETSRALIWLQDAHRDFMRSGYVRGLFNTRLSLGGLHSECGESERAEELFTAARELLPQLDSHPLDYAILLQQESLLAKARGHTQEAVEMMRESLEIKRQHPIRNFNDAVSLRVSILNLAGALMSSIPEEAAALMEEARALTGLARLSPADQSVDELQASSLLMHQHRWPEAKEKLLHAHKGLLQSGASRQDISRALCGLIATSWAMGQTDEQVAFGEELMRTASLAEQNFLREQERSSWRATYRSGIDLFIQGLMAQEKFDRAIEMVERFRSRELRGLLLRHNSTSRLPEELSQRCADLEAERDSLLAASATLTKGQTAAGMTSSQIDSLLERNTAETMLLQEKAYPPVALAEEYTCAQLLECLQDEPLTIVLNMNYSPVNGCLTVFLMNHRLINIKVTRILQHELEGAAQAVEDAMFAAQERFRNPDVTPEAGLIVGYPEYYREPGLTDVEQEALHNLYRILFAEFLNDALDKMSRFLEFPTGRPLDLVIIPCDALSNVPWAALVSQPGSDPLVRPSEIRYLIDEAAVRVFPSLAIYRQLKMRTQRLRKPLKMESLLCLANPVVGDPIPGSEAEAAAIKCHFHGTANVYARSQAQRSLLERSAPFEVIHIAAHGQFNSSRAEANGIWLSPPCGQDGTPPTQDQGEGKLRSQRYGVRAASTVLDLDPLRDLSLPVLLELRSQGRLDLSASRLLVLSACQVGKVRHNHADDWTGFLAGLIFAGCGNVVAALWNVSDVATAWLMDRVYSDLAAGWLPADALREAVRWLRNYKPREGQHEAVHAHPYFWAGFQLYGAG